MAPAEKIAVTEDDYLAAEQRSESKHELINGVVVARASASIRHNAITANMLVALGARVRGKCRAWGSDQRVHVPDTGFYTYPDVVVTCGPRQYHAKDANTLLSPTLLVEVLSPSTEAYDRGAKFAHYRRSTTLTDYVMISQTERHVEHYQRLDTGQWLLTIHEGEASILRVLDEGIEIPLAEIYEEIDEFPAVDAGEMPPPTPPA